LDVVGEGPDIVAGAHGLQAGGERSGGGLGRGAIDGGLHQDQVAGQERVLIQDAEHGFRRGALNQCGAAVGVSLSVRQLCGIEAAREDDQRGRVLGGGGSSDDDLVEIAEGVEAGEGRGGEKKSRLLANVLRAFLLREQVQDRGGAQTEDRSGSGRQKNVEGSGEGGRDGGGEKEDEAAHI
jgi:hypothetical protein